jgi:tetratricopeptide (TPR) repeat protein
LKKLVTIFFLLITSTAQGQNKNVLDSLSGILKSTKIDTIKVSVLNRLAYEYKKVKPDTCIELATKALELSNKINYPIGQADAIARIAFGRYIKGNFSLALTLFQKSMGQYEELKNQKGIYTCLNAIGVIYKTQGKYSEALDYHQKAHKITRLVNDKQGEFATLNNLGILYALMDNFSLALETMQNALAINEAIKDKSAIATCYSNISNAYSSLGNYSKELEYIQKSLKIREEIGDEWGISSCLLNIGVFYENENNFTLALEYYQKSLAIREKIGDKLFTSNSLSNIGNLYTLQKQYPLALEFNTRSLKLREQMGNKPGIANSLGKIGFVYYSQNQYQQALDFFQRSLGIREQIGDKKGICEALDGLAEVYQKLLDFDKSISLAKRSFAIAKEMKSPSEISEALAILYRSSKLKGDYATALEYHELLRTISDSLFTIEKSKTIANLEATQRIEKKVKEIELLNKNQELLMKNVQLEHLEAERQRIKLLALEKQAEADCLIALALAESNLRKQDSLKNLATKKALEAENLKMKELFLITDAKAKAIHLAKVEREAGLLQKINTLIIIGFILICIFIIIVFRSWRSERKDKQLIQLQHEELKTLNEHLELLVRERTKLLEARNKQLEEYAFFNAHKLRAPVATIMGLHVIMSLEKDINRKIALFEPLYESVQQLDKVVKEIQVIVDDQHGEID